MFTFKKCSKRLKRTVCVVLCLIVLSSLLVIPAGAEEFTGPFFISGNSYIDNVWSNQFQLSFPSPVVGSESFTSVLSSNSVDTQLLSAAPYSFYFDGPDFPVDGSIAIYVSWFVRANFESSFSPLLLSSFSTFCRVYLEDSSSYEISVPLDFSSFSAPHVDGSTESLGVRLKGRVNSIDSILDVNRLWFRLQYSGGNAYNIQKPSGIPGSLSLFVPSAVLITGESSTIDAMEGIADSISQQSQIMSAYYGDIMELLNDLYSRLGDLQAVQETANAYFAQLIPLVNSINTNTANIHSLLQTQFQLLRTLIATESGNIQDAIEQQTQDLIAYFDTVLSGSTGNMPEKSDDLESSVGNVSDAESDYQSTATERFDQLAGAFTGFSGGTLGGVTLAATLFSRVWSALGEYSIVYSWPLLLGLCLVVIGRLSRLSGGQSSSVKNRGDSDA